MMMLRYSFLVQQTMRQGWWQGIPVAVRMRKEGAMSEDDFIDEAKLMT